VVPTPAVLPVTPAQAEPPAAGSIPVSAAEAPARQLASLR